MSFNKWYSSVFSCFRCKRCSDALNLSNESTFSDEIEELNRDSDQSDCVELKEKTRWRTLKHHFMNVSITTLPARSSYCPRGMSKFTHLCDGCVDVIAVKDTSKKQFLRYLKRHGNAKNQVTTLAF